MIVIIHPVKEFARRQISFFHDNCIIRGQCDENTIVLSYQMHEAQIYLMEKFAWKKFKNSIAYSGLLIKFLIVASIYFLDHVSKEYARRMKHDNRFSVVDVRLDLNEHLCAFRTAFNFHAGISKAS